MTQDELPDSCTTRMAYAAASGFAAGAIGGAVTSNWGDVPKVLRTQNWPALKYTGRIMRQYGLAIGFVGVGFSATECFGEHLRGKKDVWNGVMGSLAAGGVMGVSLGRMPLAAGAAGLFAATSLAVDFAGGRLVGTGMVDDGATPPPLIFPYPQQLPSEE